MRKRLAGAALAMLCGASVFAQTPQVSGSVVGAGAVLVQVPALVTAASQESDFALSASDFQLKDNGVGQRVRVDQDATRPLSLVVLMQTGNAARLVLPLYRKLEAMLAVVLGSAPYRVSIVSFDSRVEGATPFTANVADWTDAINEPEDGDHGAAVFDGLAFALKQLSAEPAGNRRAILLISQPQDDGSKTSAKAILRASGESNTAIYSVTFSPEKASFKAQINGAPRLNAPIVVNPSFGPTQAYFNLSEPLRLLLGGLRKNAAAAVAGETGGEPLQFNTEKELAFDLNLLTNHLANRYLLTFSPSVKEPGLHVLDVRLVGHPELSVTARHTYWLSLPQ